MLTHAKTTEEFEKLIKGDKPVLVDFFATWCGPCQMMGPVLDEMAEKYENKDKVEIVKVDIDELGEIASKYEVMSVPTFATFEKGEMKEKMVGVRPQAELESKLTALLK